MRAKFRILILLPLIPLMTACGGFGRAPQTQTISCPSFPPPQAAVGKELDAVCLARDTKQNYCPATFEWLGRLHKLDEKLKVLQ